MSSIPQTDIVFVKSLELSANIGDDRWGKARAQPLLVSIYLHLRTSFLVRAGDSDDVRDSIHYGYLSKVIGEVVESSNDFSSIYNLIHVVTKAAFEQAGEPAAAVKVVVDLRQMILLASGFSVEVTTPSGTDSASAPSKVYVKDLVMATIIGVNPPERQAKQRIIINIVFHEKAGLKAPVDYRPVVSAICKVSIFSMILLFDKPILDFRKSKARRI